MVLAFTIETRYGLTTPAKLFPASWAHAAENTADNTATLSAMLFMRHLI
jgi:hypothetical protein